MFFVLHCHYLKMKTNFKIEITLRALRYFASLRLNSEFLCFCVLCVHTLCSLWLNYV